MRVDDWVLCSAGEGFEIANGKISNRKRHFKKNSVGLIKSISDDFFAIWLIGPDQTWNIPIDAVQPIEIKKTGDRFDKKICNICHCLLPVGRFAINQNNQWGPVRRPSCADCRTKIDKRAPKTSQAKRMEKNRPRKGTAFKCPICQKRSIVGVTASIVADHNHHTGDIRDFICDSCNTGLGRFKNGENYLKNAIAYLGERNSR